VIDDRAEVAELLQVHGRNAGGARQHVRATMHEHIVRAII